MRTPLSTRRQQPQQINSRAIDDFSDFDESAEVFVLNPQSFTGMGDRHPEPASQDLGTFVTYDS
jgi:hypothetical protein